MYPPLWTSLLVAMHVYEISVEFTIFRLTIKCFRLWKSAIMDQSVTFRKRVLISAISLRIMSWFGGLVLRVGPWSLVLWGTRERSPMGLFGLPYMPDFCLILLNITLFQLETNRRGWTWHTYRERSAEHYLGF